MFSLFARLADRHRTIRPQVRIPLRLECLEARANPAAPVVTNVTAAWGDEHIVVLRGNVQDETIGQAVMQVAGAVQLGAAVDQGGTFVVALRTTGTGPIYFRAEDNQLTSEPITIDYGKPAPDPVVNEPGLSDVTISRGDDGLWHIHGHVGNSSPIGTIIEILNGPGNTSGQTGAVDLDGSFDIVLDLPEGSGGVITIIGIDGESGGQSDPWDGLIG